MPIFVDSVLVNDLTGDGTFPNPFQSIAEVRPGVGGQVAFVSAQG